MLLLSPAANLLRPLAEAKALFARSHRIRHLELGPLFTCLHFFLGLFQAVLRGGLHAAFVYLCIT